MKPVSNIVPCVWVDDQAEQAAEFYLQTFPAGQVITTSYYPQTIDNPSGKLRGSVLSVEFEIADQRFTVVNGGPVFTLNPSISFFIHVDALADADRLFKAFTEGGETLMPLDRYPWSERYGWVTDRFGVSWQVIAGRREKGGAVIVPCLMFARAQHGQAEKAMRFYSGVFSDSRIDRIERYLEGEGPPDKVKHGRFSLAGHDLVAMDSHIDHEFTFNEALSLQVICADQTEVDRYWDALTEGGEHGPCGWLKDRFRISWQVVPTAFASWMASTDTAARDRVFEAMLSMQKLDIKALQDAFEGR